MLISGTAPGKRAREGPPDEEKAGMLWDPQLLMNAIVSGLLLGGFYAVVTVGVSISFGMLDIVNIAHPAFIMLGSYVAFLLNSTYALDPILGSLVMMPAFFA